MNETMDRIVALRAKRDAICELLESFDAVRDHLIPKLNPGSITLTVLAEQRALLKDEVKRVIGEVRDIQAACPHAWERIGDARPPIERCVRCTKTRALWSERGADT